MRAPHGLHFAPQSFKTSGTPKHMEIEQIQLPDSRQESGSGGGGASDILRPRTNNAGADRGNVTVVWSKVCNKASDLTKLTS